MNGDSSEKKLISVVAPIYFEEALIKEFYRRLKAVLSDLKDEFNHEMIFVNDGSKDRSLEELQTLRDQDDTVKIISFSRNFGHQLAITAGVDFAGGDVVVVIDADLQDPPEVIKEMIAKWREGYKVVYGQRMKREGENPFKLITAKLFYRLINKLSDIDLPLDTGDFRLMDRKVVLAYRQMREENRYIRGMVTWVGFNQCALSYKRDARYAGETKYTLRKMFAFALNGLTSFSEKPLRISSYLGFCVTAISCLLIVYLILGKFINPKLVVQGWTSTLLIIIFFGGVQLLTVGILGEYIGRIYREVKKRPLYVVEDAFGFDSTEGLETESSPKR